MKLTDRNGIEKRFNFLKNDQQNWISAWKDLQRFIKPKRGFFEGQTPNSGAAIDHRTQLDGTPSRAARTLAAGMSSGLTSPARPWFKLGIPDTDLMKFEPVKFWLADTQRKMLDIFSRSNTYGVLHSNYEEVGVFGTGASMIVEDFETVIRGRSYTIGEYFIGQGADGRVNTFGRFFTMTRAQLIEEYGEDNVSDAVRIGWKESPDTLVNVYHLVEPNNERIPNRKDFRNKAFRSVTWEASSDQETCLRYGGFDEFPYLIPRWDTTNSTFNYGWGPGHDALGDTKMLMKLQKDKLVALDKMIDPPVQQDGLVSGESNTMPGGVTRVSSIVPNAGVRAAYQIAVPIDQIRIDIQETRRAIEDTFYNSLFLMLANSEPGEQTAYEISKRYEEKLLQLGPVIERLKGELHDPLIARTFAIGMRKGAFLPPPPELQGMALNVVYISTLAQAQKMVGTTAIQQVTAFAQSFAPTHPQAMDVVDADESVRKYAEMLGAEPEIIHSDEEIQAIREGRAKAKEAAAIAANAGNMVQGAKTLSETELNKGSALDALTGGSMTPQQGAAA